MNVGRISHIVSFAPDGPRGDPLLSPRLTTALSNLMLTCGDHAKVIDDPGLVADYPVALLQTFKREHEDRVRTLTDVQGEFKADVVIMKAAVNTRVPDIPEEDAFRAMLPLYPSSEKAHIIDLSATRTRLASQNLEFLSRELAAECRRRRIGEGGGALAVFALAPIPLLVDFGCLLGDLGRVHLFQRHRSPVEGWAWPTVEDVDAQYYELYLPLKEQASEAVVVLAVSSGVTPELLPPKLLTLPKFEIRASSPSKDFLVSSGRLKAFGVCFRNILGEIRSRHPRLKALHLFAAVPAPVAVEVGRHLHGMDASLIVYEFNEPKRSYDSSLLVDRHQKDS